MARRRIRTGVLAGALSLALLAAGCGDSKENDKAKGTDNTTADQGGGNDKLASTDCGQLEYDADAPTGGEYVDYAYMSDSGTNTSFDPGVVQTLNESQITSSLFDGLTDFDFTEKCAPELKGSVAESWEVNDDATEITFTLKGDREFSNGEPIKPSNFKKAWERAGSAELASPYGYLVTYIEGGEDLQAGEADELSGVTADDEAMTLTVKLSAPNADFPAIVSHPFFSPADNADLEKVGNTTGWGTKGLTVGNGPFKLEKADETEVVLVPNENWKGNVYGDTTVHLDKLTFVMSSTVEAAYQTFEAGEGDSAPVPSGKFQSAMKAYPKNSVVEPNMGSYYFDFGFEDPDLGGEENLPLRKAISLAIDREEINTKVYEGTRSIATGVVPPGIPGFKADLAEYAKLDVDQAKTYLKEWEDAGGKLSRPIKINYNEGGSPGDVAQIIQSNLKNNLGLDVELAPVAEDYFRVVAEEGGCNLCRSGWYADYPTYGNFMVDLFSKAAIGGNNFGRYDNPDFEAKIKAAQAETDEVKRGELYNEAEDILLNQTVDAVPLVYYVGGQVFRDRVLNYDQPPLGVMLWERVALEG